MASILRQKITRPRRCNARQLRCCCAAAAAVVLLLLCCCCDQRSTADPRGENRGPLSPLHIITLVDKHSTTSFLAPSSPRHQEGPNSGREKCAGLRSEVLLVNSVPWVVQLLLLRPVSIIERSFGGRQARRKITTTTWASSSPSSSGDYDAPHLSLQ